MHKPCNGLYTMWLCVINCTWCFMGKINFPCVVLICGTERRDCIDQVEPKSDLIQNRDVMNMKDVLYS